MVDTAPVTPPKTRVTSVDALRGLVMIIMALDHTREFFHSGAMTFQPEDLTRTTAILFFTRWVTHICAPVFMFTAGLGAFLWLRPGRTPSQLSHFLWKRGLWLVLLELTVLRLALDFSLRQRRRSCLRSSGRSAGRWWRSASSCVCRFVPWPCLSIAVIALHNLADPVSARQFGAPPGPGTSCISPACSA